jgi:hypothetical protein
MIFVEKEVIILFKIDYEIEQLKHKIVNDGDNEDALR